MTDPTLDPAAVEAAAEALCDVRCDSPTRGCDTRAETLDRHFAAAAAALTAAAPILLAAHEAQVIEVISQAIDQAWAEAKDRDRNDGGYRDGYLDGLEHAEGIARSARIADPAPEETP